MSDKKLVVVLGSTGNQGGSVIKTLLGNPETREQFRLRGVTRDASKPKAKALEEKGVEMVSGDINNEEDIKRIFKGAYAVFAVTNFWEKMDKALEIKQGRTMADVAKAEGVQHYIWSSLPYVAKISKGKYTNVHHFDGKAEVEEYIRDLGIPASFLLTGFFMLNMPGAVIGKKEKGEWFAKGAFPPNSPLPVFDTAEDTGKFVSAILQNRDSLLGKQVFGGTEMLTPLQMLEQFKEVYPKAGKDLQWEVVSNEDYAKSLKEQGMPPHIVEDLTENMKQVEEFGFNGPNFSLDESLALLDEKPTTWKEYIKKDKYFQGVE